MTQNKFTPAPWHFETVDEKDKDQTYRIYSDVEPLEGTGWREDETKNLIMADTQYYPFVPNINDARLMAASPDLYRALKDMIKAQTNGGYEVLINGESAIDRAVKAIAKAEGV